MKHIVNTIAFYAKYPGLHAFNKRCKCTVRAIKSLESSGHLKVDWETCDAEFTGKCNQSPY